MKFTCCGALVDESFRFESKARKNAFSDLSQKHNPVDVESFLSDCEQIIILWLSLQEPKTPNSELNERLINLSEKSKSLYLALASMPIDCADTMNSESLMFGRELMSFTGELEENLIMLQELSARCLIKLQISPGQDRGHIKQLVLWIVEAYQRIFNRLPIKSKNDTNAFFKFLQVTVANAISEQIGFDLYSSVLNKVRV